MRHLMASRDLHNLIKNSIIFVLRAIIINTTSSGSSVDTLGLQSVEIIMTGGDVLDGSYQLAIFDASDAGFSDAAPVAPEFLIGNISDMKIDSSDKVLSIGYVGHRRFLTVEVVSTGVTSGITGLSVIVVADSPNHSP